MRELRQLFTNIDRQLEEAARAKQQLDAEQWREQLRPSAMRPFAARTAKLQCSCALLKLLVEELYPDDLFTELVGDLDRVPLRRWPQVVAIAVALRHSWRRAGFATIGKRLHVSPTEKRSTNGPLNVTPGHHDVDSSARLDPVKAFRFAPTPFGAHGLDRLSVEPMEGTYVMAGRHEGRSRKDRTMREISPTPNIAVTIGVNWFDNGRTRA